MSADRVRWRLPLGAGVAVAVTVAVTAGVWATRDPGATPSSTPSSRTPACPSDREPARQADGPSATADLDGDGRADTLVLDVPPGGEEPVSLRAELAAGGTVSVVLDDADRQPWVDIASTVDVDGDGTREALVYLGGNTARLFALVTLEGCRLARVSDEDGAPATLVAGASPAYASGVECDGQHVVMREFEQDDRGHGTLRERRYVLDADRLRLVDDSTTGADAPPPDIATVCGA